MKELFRKIFNKIGDEFFTIPNMLSIVRILLIPVIVYLYCFRHDNISTFAVVAFSTLTDIVDGYIARRFDMITDFGKFLDPVADKATQLTVLVCLITRFKYMVIPFVVLAIKEIFSLVLRFIAYRETEMVEGAKWHGKAATGIIVAAIGIHLLWDGITVPVSIGFVAFATVFMVFSGVLYTVDVVRMMKNYEKQD